MEEYLCRSLYSFEKLEEEGKKKQERKKEMERDMPTTKGKTNTQTVG